MISTMSFKLDEQDKRDIASKAKAVGMSSSAYLAKMVRDHLAGVERMDLLVRGIHEECLQIEGMLGIMQSFNQRALTILLGRVEPNGNLAEAKEKRDKAAAMLDKLLSKALEDVFNGENIWGTADLAVKGKENNE